MMIDINKLISKIDADRIARKYVKKMSHPKNVWKPIPIYISQEMLQAINPYPKWTKKQIKRKYGKHPAQHIDVWIPFENLFDLLPKVKPPNLQWNTKK